MKMKIEFLFTFWIFLGGVEARLGRRHRRCKETGYLVNANYNTDLYRKYVRVYSCKKNYVSNIPGLSEIDFICRYDKKKGNYKWTATVTKFINGDHISLSDVTCKLKDGCYDPPLPDHMERQVTVRSEAAVAHELIPEVPDKFYEGDTLTYSCQDGYEQKREVMTNGVYDEYESYGYYDYNYPSDESSKTIDTKLECDNAGRWSGKEIHDLNFGECVAIRCNATRFQDIWNGNITDFHETYEFLEEMRLVCDYGFRPKKGINSVICTSSTSFEEMNLPEMGCERILCIEPTAPRNGHLKLPKGLNIGDKAIYECNSDYNLIGKAQWTCQPNGLWDSECVICNNGDSYCSPPCIPLGADVSSVEETYPLHTVLEFTCKSGEYFGGSKSRTCMLNKQWSGEPIDCTGSVLDKDVGFDILAALKQIPFNNSAQSETDEVIKRSIDVGSADGVDVYLVVDISSSITLDKFNETNEFLKALLPELGIGRGHTDTRLALSYFASETYTEFNQHYKSADDIFESYKDAQQAIFNATKKINKIRRKTKFGTAIHAALDSVYEDVTTKLVMYQKMVNPYVRKSQQVVILISDGEYNTHGNPINIANALKKKYGVEIYAVAVGKPEPTRYGFKAMEKIASHIKGERHFFQINDRDNNLHELIKEVSNPEGYITSCGKTKPYLTMISNNEAHYEMDAMPDAWPWMAQLRTWVYTSFCHFNCVFSFVFVLIS